MTPFERSARSLVAPGVAATNVGATAMFEWTPVSQVARLTVTCKGPSDAYTTFNVVTSDSKTQLPLLGGPPGIAWPKSMGCSWDVELHGSYETVDDATGPIGYLDPFSLYFDGELWGPKRDNGLFSLTGGRSLSTAP
jgi:hypothetical protein